MKIYRGTYPRSSELYHYGILGQKWGVRRFQNPDGSLTAEGRERYGSGKGESTSERIKTGARHVGNAIGKAAKATGKAVGKAAVATGKFAAGRVKRRFPSLMTKEELDDYTKRLASEKSIIDMRKYIRSNRSIPALNFIGDVLSEGGKTISRAAFNKLATEMLKSSRERERERIQDELNEIDYQIKKSSTGSKLYLERQNNEILKLYDILTTYPRNTVEYLDAEDRLEVLNRERSRFSKDKEYEYVPFPSYGEKKK